MGPGTGQTVDGVNPKTFVFVTVYRNRLWFIEQNSTRAWYLGTGVIAGTASRSTSARCCLRAASWRRSSTGPMTVRAGSAAPAWTTSW
jgi:hypothetical protein